MEKAILVFKLNNEIHPNSADGFDSLGEAFYTNGQWNEALRSYKQALVIDPQYENAKSMIEKIGTRR
ncbi:MAG: tetratricopeptide repeat protein [Bacteroidota bacterium]